MNVGEAKRDYSYVRGHDHSHAHAGTLEPRELLHFLQNNLGKIGLCVAAAIAAVMLYLHVTRPIYTSAAMLEIESPAGQNTTTTEVDTLDNLKTIEMKLASRPVLLGVVRGKHLADDPVFAQPAVPGYLPDSDLGRWVARSTGNFLRFTRLDRIFGAPASPADNPAAPSEDELVKRLGKMVSVNVVRGSRLISLSVEAHRPEQAQQRAQAVIDEFFRQSREDRSRDSVSAREQLLAESKRVAEELKISEEKLEAYRDRYNAVSLQDRQNIVVERMRELNQQVASAKNARLTMEAEQAKVRTLADTDPDQLLSLHSIADLPEILDLRKQITLQEAQMATLAQRYGPLHPTMIQSKSQLDELHASLRAALRKACDRLVQSYESTKATETALEAALAEQEKAALELDRIAIPYRALERDAQANAGAYQKVLDELKQSDVTHGLVSASDIDGIEIHVVEPPPVPDHPTRPRPKLLLGLALLLGLFAGGGVALVSRALDNSLASVDEAEAFCDLRVLASIPRSRHRRLNADPLVLRDPASPQAEAFRTLRTSLELLGGDQERRCVLFTSAVPAEGKSFCSLNCAAAFAQQGLRTLLIDGDLRRPSLQWLFGDPTGQPGLSECLRDPARFAEAVQGCPVENLFRLGDWQHQSGCAELLARGGMREIIRLGLANYDRVVIDSAPLMAVSDTLHLVRDVPTVCLVAHAGRTPRRLVRRALRLLAEVGERPAAGLVLNKVNSRTSADHYYYYNA
ncbi:MAG TPA: polysaccharide biosynthesis tyrosine autokinase [Opitutaceae bacterium]|nr:polysaccharide biosynthesis tyrosine autokinase [Opitutaceae bacterium]